LKAVAVVLSAAQCFAAADELLRAGERNATIRALRGYPEPFEGLIEEVYRSDKEEYAFRLDWFADCIGKPL
jgi:hypothetical protein